MLPFPTQLLPNTSSGQTLNWAQGSELCAILCPRAGAERKRKGNATGPHERKLSTSVHLPQPSKAFCNALHLIGLPCTLLVCKTETRTTKHHDIGLEGSSSPSPVLPDRSRFPRPNNYGLLTWGSGRRSPGPGRGKRTNSTWFLPIPRPVYGIHCGTENLLGSCPE